MKKITKSLAALSCVGLFGLAVAGCKSTDSTSATTSDLTTSTPTTIIPTTSVPTTSGGASNTTDVSDLKEYKIKAECINGKPIADAEIIIKGKGVEESQYTDKDGYATFELKDQTYTIYPENLPGYTVQENYYGLIYDTASDENVVKYDPSLILDPRDESSVYYQGDVMYDKEFKGIDFSGSTPQDNASTTLSQLLEENDLVVLNFWYSTCSWCIKEFPYLISAYEEYKDKGVELIGINTSDSASVLLEYGIDLGLNFLNTYGDTEYLQAFQITSTPTTILIDRYGLVAYIHSGAITDEGTWKGLFDEYLSEDYVPTYIPTNENGDVEWQVPDPEKGPKFPGSEALANAALADGIEAEFSEKISDEYTANWPWIVSEDGKSIQPSNSKVDYSYSTTSIKVNVPANKVLAFDYVSSCEVNDILGVFVGSTLIAQISGGTSDTAYIYATSNEAEEIVINLLYRKDQALSQNDDTVYISNIRFVEIAEVPYSMYVIRQATYGNYDKFNGYENCIKPVFNEEDGYYHVGSVDGPLLYAALLDSNTHFSGDSIVNTIYKNPDIFSKEVTNVIIKYAQYAVNSVFNIYTTIPTEGLTPITKELYAAMLEIVKTIGTSGEFYSDEKELLEMCVYIDEYLKNGDKPMGDPIKGLATFNALEAYEGVNSIEYKYAFVPRGYTVKFIPKRTGVYLFKSLGDAEAMIFLSNDGITKYQNSATARDYYYTLATTNLGDPFYEYMYCEAGKTYYFSPTFWAVDQIGVLEYEIEYLGESGSYLASCSEPAFTSSDANMSDIISKANLEYGLGDDGYYHPLDENGNIVENEYIYADFKFITGVFSYQALDKIIENGGFDFTKDENGNPAKGEDLTSVAQKYLALCEEDSTSQFFGLVKVNVELANLLQMLMDKYTFPNVEGSWLKLCYFVKHLGA